MPVGRSRIAGVIGVSGWLGYAAQKAVSKGSFLKGFFLGNRGLGVWAMAFLGIAIVGMSVLLGKKLGALFRV